MNDNEIDDQFMQLAEKVLMCVDGVNLEGTPVKLSLSEKKQIACEVVALLDSGDEDAWTLFKPECGGVGEISSNLIRLLALSMGTGACKDIPTRGSDVSGSQLIAFIRMEADYKTLLSTARQIMSAAVNIFVYRDYLRAVAGTDYLNQNE